MTKHLEFKVGENYRKYIMWFAVAMFYLICFKIVLGSGYMFDDMWTYIDKGLALRSGKTAFDMAWESTVSWATVYGRILVFSGYSEIVLCTFPLWLYKLFIVVLIIIDGLLLRAVARELTGSDKLGNLCMAMFPACISMRATYYTGVYAFHGLVQMCMMLVLLAVYFYIRYRRTAKVRYQVASCVFWFLSLGMYEVAYSLCLCFIVALICIDGWDYVRKHLLKSVATGLPHIIIMILWLIGNVVARSNLQINYEGATANLSLPKMFATFLRQCSGSIGFGAALKDIKMQSIGFWLGFAANHVGVVQIATYVIFFCVMLMMLLRFKDNIKNKLTGMVWFGVILWVAPALLICVSYRYQQEVEWFQGYIPAYFGSWGLALIAAAAVVYIGRRCRTHKGFVIFNVVVAAVFTAVFAVDNVVGMYSVEDADSYYQDQADTMVASIDAGMFDDITEDDYFLDVSGSTYSMFDDFTNMAYTTWLNRICKARAFNDICEVTDGKLVTNVEYDNMMRDGFRLVNQRPNKFAVMAECDDFAIDVVDGEVVYSAHASVIELFLYKGMPDTFTCVDESGRTVEVNVSDGTVAGKGKYGTLYRFEFESKIDVSSIIVGD